MGRTGRRLQLHHRLRCARHPDVERGLRACVRGLGFLPDKLQRFSGARLGKRRRHAGHHFRQGARCQPADFCRCGNADDRSRYGNPDLCGGIGDELRRRRYGERAGNDRRRCVRRPLFDFGRTKNVIHSLLRYKEAIMFDNSDTLKECYSCYVIRPITDFHVSRWTPEGRKKLCKICTRDYRAERTRRLTPLSLDGIVRECSGCRETKPLTEFHKSITGTYGYSGKCKICARLTSGKWRAKNVSRKADDNRRAFYGLSPERYAAMVSAQNGR